MKKEEKSFTETLEIQDISLFKYVGCLPAILEFQIVTKAALFAITYVLKYLASTVVASTNTMDFTNTDIPRLFTSFRGLVILGLGILIIAFAAVFDINAMILIADNFIHKKEKRIRDILKESILSMQYLLHPAGLLVIAYVSFIAPLTMSFYGISMTESFYIPDFIMDFIMANTGLKILYYVVIIIFFVLGVIYIFTMHYMVVGKVNAYEAMKLSYKTMKKNWKDFLKQMLIFEGKALGVVAVVLLLFVGLPFLGYYLIAKGNYSNFWVTFIGLQTIFVGAFIKVVFLPFQFMKLNRLYEHYADEKEGEMLVPDKSNTFWFILTIGLSYVLIIALSGAAMIPEVFDIIFPTYRPSTIIAHRAGGDLGNENTVIGVEAAIEYGVPNSEIDVQRTKDGKYVIFHDHTFDRLCNVDKAVNELTLEEIKKLEVPNTFTVGAPSTSVATLEEILDAAKGKIHLFIELKDETADEQMVDDVYKAVHERGMEKEVTFISMKYPLLEKTKKDYPEITTGYLCFISLGKISSLNVDYLMLEDEMATEDIIAEAHSVGKKVFIWTINTDDGMRKRLTDDSDGVITDNVDLARIVYNLLAKESKLSRVANFILYVM
ncbi:MAG: glycerophosphoryl diester phosphodiesterase membrane domain-containing protein [Holdemanella sp.]|nr:glycerophosphoryl diester phosphodiesterase membrane domain-containing protein [Holdemanella sp.]